VEGKGDFWREKKELRRSSKRGKTHHLDGTALFSSCKLGTGLGGFWLSTCLKPMGSGAMISRLSWPSFRVLVQIALITASLRRGRPEYSPFSSGGNRPQEKFSAYYKTTFC